MPEQEPITRDSVVVVSNDQISADLAGEAAVLNQKSGVYFGLNATGSRIWRLIHEPQTVARIEEVLFSEYEIEPDRCARDVLAFITALAAQGLVEVVG